MNEATLNYVRQHADDDVRQLALRGCKDPEVDLPMALQQIQGRQTARRKLPSWAAIEGVVYPPRLSMEQCSSEATARYKAKVIDDLRIDNLRLNSSEDTVRSQIVNCKSVNRKCASRSQIVNCKSVNRKLVDLTAGFGVDLAFMSQAFDQAVYVERDAALCAIAKTNMPLVTATPVECVCADGLDYLRAIGHCSMIFLDPARRDTHGSAQMVNGKLVNRKLIALADCTPNVIPIIDDLLARADTVMLKLSPMLDWRKAVNDLGVSRVAEVHIVAVDNECKELLVILQREAKPLRLVCVNIDSGSVGKQCAAAPLPCRGGVPEGRGGVSNILSARELQTPPPTPPLEGRGVAARPFSTIWTFRSDPIAEPSAFSASELSSTLLNSHTPTLLKTFTLPQKTTLPLHSPVFLYEPNAAIMKSGCFAALARDFAVTPLAHDSHLFIADRFITDFPGRRFRITATTTMNKRDLRDTLKDITRANITVRNFPLTAEQLRKRLKIADGGSIYLFATTLADGQHCLFVCEKCQ